MLATETRDIVTDLLLWNDLKYFLIALKYFCRWLFNPFITLLSLVSTAIGGSIGTVSPAPRQTSSTVAPPQDSSQSQLWDPTKVDTRQLSCSCCSAAYFAWLTAAVSGTNNYGGNVYQPLPWIKWHLLLPSCVKEHNIRWHRLYIIRISFSYFDTILSAARISFWFV